MEGGEHILQHNLVPWARYELSTYRVQVITVTDWGDLHTAKSLLYADCVCLRMCLFSRTFELLSERLQLLCCL